MYLVQVSLVIGSPSCFHYDRRVSADPDLVLRRIDRLDRAGREDRQLASAAANWVIIARWQLDRDSEFAVRIEALILALAA